MRKGFLLVVLFVSACIATALFTTGCTERKTTAEDTDTVVADTDTAVADTMESIIAETPMPKAADELFDDFVFNFAANKKLQLRRIKFPLTVVRNGKTEMLDEKAWKMEHFFMRQDYYTLIFDNHRQMNVVKDTAVSRAVVEKIYLDKESVKQYVFNRRNGLWTMDSIVFTSFRGNSNASFLQFYQKFATDSAFQVASINDPLDFTGPNPDDDFENMSGILAPEQWPSFAPELPQHTIYNILYGQKYGRSSQKIFVIRGIANGLETELTFMRKGDQWKLMKLIM